MTDHYEAPEVEFEVRSFHGEIVMRNGTVQAALICDGQDVAYLNEKALQVLLYAVQDAKEDGDFATTLRRIER